MPEVMLGAPVSVIDTVSACRKDGRRNLDWVGFRFEDFVELYDECHQEQFGRMSGIAILRFLIVRLRGALHCEWVSSLVALQRCVRSGVIEPSDMLVLCNEIINNWSRVRRYIRTSGIPQHVDAGRDLHGVDAYVYGDKCMEARLHLLRLFLELCKFCFVLRSCCVRRCCYGLVVVSFYICVFLCL